jgi:hypothetical protein
MDYRMPFFPIPVLIQPQAPEQVPISLEGLLEGIDEKGFTEASRSGKEIIGSLLNQLVHKSGFIDIRITSGNNLTQGADADGKLFHYLRF